MNGPMKSPLMVDEKVRQSRRTAAASTWPSTWNEPVSSQGWGSTDTTGQCPRASAHIAWGWAVSHSSISGSR